MTDQKPEYINQDEACIDTTLGTELWRLETADCPAELRSRLETHVTYCAACRLQLAVERKVVAGLGDGSLVLRRPAPAYARYAVWSASVGITAVACSLALMLLLPPIAPHSAMTMRGDDGPSINRPVPDEVVLGGQPTIRWTPLEGVTSYNVQVETVDGNHRWSTNTPTAEITVPASDELPLNMRCRIRIEPVPAHLAPAEGLRTSFRTGSTGSWIQYRLGHAKSISRWFGGFGLAGILAGVAGLLTRRSAG